MTRFSIRFLLSSRAKYSARKKVSAILLARKCVRAEAIPVAAHATSNTFGGLRDRNGNLPASQRGIGKWFDTSCFATPRAGTLGNSGAFVLEGPGYNMQHISVAKTFRLTERVKFTFTAAASNVLNHPNFGLPASNISVPASAGVVSSLVAGSASRLIDLRGRIDF